MILIQLKIWELLDWRRPFDTGGDLLWMNSSGLMYILLGFVCLVGGYYWSHVRKELKCRGTIMNQSLPMTGEDSIRLFSIHSAWKKSTRYPLKKTTPYSTILIIQAVYPYQKFQQSNNMQNFKIKSTFTSFPHSQLISHSILRAYGKHMFLWHSFL